MTQVIIDDVIPRTQLTAAASQTVFNTNWTANATTDILVYARVDGVEPDDATQLVSSSLYNVTFIGASQTVRVTFLSGRVLNDIITIVRNTPADRMNLYINTNFTPSMLNEDFGILTLVDQQAQMYDTVVNPGYNVSATIANKDKVLPILGANQIWAMNDANDAIIAYDVPSSGGLAPDDATYLLKTANTDLPNAQVMGNLATGLVVNTTGTGVQLTRILAAVANQLAITNSSGLSGSPTYGFADNARFPGTEGIGLVVGTTAQRPITPVGTNLRFNTDLLNLEYWDGTNWVQLSETDAVTIQGTENQVLANGTFGMPLDGAIILTLPQDIATTSTPTFAAVRTGVIEGSTGLDIAQFVDVPSSVNYFRFTNAITGVGPTVQALGPDTDITLNYVSKAAGLHSFSSTSSSPLVINSGTGYQHHTAFAFANTAQSRTVTFQDLDGTVAFTGDIPTGAALTRTNDTNVTLTLGGSPNTALLNAASLTLGWSGQLSEIRGGTAQSSYALGDTLYSSATNTLSKLAGNITTTKQYLSQTGNGATSAAPLWSTIAGSDITGAALTKTDDTNVTLTLGGTPTTSLLRAVSIALGWTGILSKARGGTSVASATIAPTSLEFSAWDTNLNLSANAFISGFATTATAAGTTTLTVASKQIQEFTGSTTQTVVMPVTSTLVAGESFSIINNSSGNLTINSSGGNLILTMAANTTATFVCVLNSGTTAASWNSSYVFDQGAGVVSLTGTANQVIFSASTGAITASLPQSIGTTSDVTFGSVAFSPNTKGLVGTATNDSAGAGYVGEYQTISVTGSPVSLTNNTSTNLAQLTSLPAGDWDLWCNVSVNSASTTVLGAMNVWISTSSASLPADSSQIARQDWGSTGISRVGSSVSAGSFVLARLTLASATTVYASCFASFTTSTLNMIGILSARRRR
jgi:hypothetical protein